MNLLNPARFGTPRDSASAHVGADVAEAPSSTGTKVVAGLVLAALAGSVGWKIYEGHQKSLADEERELAEDAVRRKQDAEKADRHMRARVYNDAFASARMRLGIGPSEPMSKEIREHLQKEAREQADITLAEMDHFIKNARTSGNG